MKKSNYKILLAGLIICIIAALTITAMCIAAYSNPHMQSVTVPVTLCIIICAVLLAAICIMSFSTRKELTFFNTLLKNFDDFAFISYDKKRRIVNIHGEVEAITGISINVGTLLKKDYDMLLERLYLIKDEFENDIYRIPNGKKWYRLASYTARNIEYVTIRDVTEYMNKINIINNLSYYDSLTGLFNKKATIDMLKRTTETGYKSLAIAHFSISGLERLTSIEGVEAADEIIIKLAAVVKNYENPQNAYAGRTENNGITVVLTSNNKEFDDYGEMIKIIHTTLIDTLKELSDNIQQYLKAYCGYAIYRGDENNAVKMLSEAEFAAFSASKNNSTEPIKYDSTIYEESAIEFKKTRIFNEIISGGLIDYHYQPIVNAHNGDIYGYEALMRPHEIDGTRLSPIELLDIAIEQNMLERVEKLTFNMTLKSLSENQNIFHDKRLFVNSVSCITLSDAEYQDIITTYGELFPKLVVEVTETNKLSDNIIPVLDKHFRPHKAHVALDDYGSGYSNDKTLIDVMPNYIKIDRSLITDINSDEHKRQLVSNIVSYANSHGVFSLAEGVETEAELETVIFLGIDLIQGYVTCRPVPIFMHEIASDIKELIVKYSIMHSKRDDKVFEVKDNKPVDLVNLAVFGYTDITVKTASADFYGNADTALNLRIICSDNMNISMRFKDVNLHNDEYPVLEVGTNSNFTLWLEGENTLSNQGIRVPETSEFSLEGAGNLKIDCSFADGVCLGGNSTQTFGKINLNSTGILDLTNKCDKCVCIGGGSGDVGSLISVNSGQIIMHAHGVDALGLGTLSGEVQIQLYNCKIDAHISGMNAGAVGSIYGNAKIRVNTDITVNGTGNSCCIIGSQHGFADVLLDSGEININASGMRIVCIGSTDGSTHIESSVNLVSVTSGDDCCLVGTLEGTACKITINDGNLKLTCNAKKIAAIGSISGECDVMLSSGIFDILCEGNNAVCVGNLDGTGNIQIGNIIMSAVENSASRQNIMTKNGTVTITSGNIYTNSLDPIEAYSPGGTPLFGYVAEGYDRPLNIKLKDSDTTYRYAARPTFLFEGIYIYAPENSVRYKRI